MGSFRDHALPVGTPHGIRRLKQMVQGPDFLRIPFNKLATYTPQAEDKILTREIPPRHSQIVDEPGRSTLGRPESRVSNEKTCWGESILSHQIDLDLPVPCQQDFQKSCCRGRGRSDGYRSSVQLFD